MLNASKPKIESKDDEKEWSTVHMRLGIVVKPLLLRIKKYSSDGVEGVLSAIHQDYYAQLCELDVKETKNIKIAAMGAGLGARFYCTR